MFDEKQKWLIGALIALVIFIVSVWSIIQHINYGPIETNDPEKSKKESAKLAYLIAGVVGAVLSLFAGVYCLMKYLDPNRAVSFPPDVEQKNDRSIEPKRKIAKPFDSKTLEVLVVCPNLEDMYNFGKIVKELAHETNSANITLLRLPKMKKLKQKWILEDFIKQDLETIDPDINIRIVKTAEDNLSDFLMNEDAQVPSYDFMFWAGCNEAIDESQLSDLDDLLNENNPDMRVYMMRDGEFLDENPFTDKFIAMIESDRPGRPNFFKLFGYPEPPAPRD